MFAGGVLVRWVGRVNAREARPVGNRIRFRFSIGRGASLASYKQGVDVAVRPASGETTRSAGSGLSVPQIGLGFRAPASRAALENVGMVEESVEQSGDGGVVAEEFAPVIDGTVQVRMVEARS